MKIEKKTYRSGPYQGFFAQGTQVGNVLYLSGQVGIDQDGNTPTKIADQAKVAYTNMPDSSGDGLHLWFHPAPDKAPQG